MAPSFVFISFLLFFVNILNYLDRGIIPGASEEFNSFITDTGIKSNPNAFLGLLQSAFIIGYSVASVIFGHSSHFYSPFTICTIGMSVWLIAVVFSGLSYFTNSYICLLLARMISGVGEAAFQISIPPWISKYAPPNQRGIFLSLFFTASPVGTAIGFAYAASIATTIGWRYCFFIEAAVMLVFIPIVWSISPHYPSESNLQTKSSSSITKRKAGNNPENKGDSTADELYEYLPGEDTLTIDQEVEDEEVRNLLTEPPFLQEIKTLLMNPIYVSIVAAFSAQAGSVVGISTFGSAFLIGLGFFDTEIQSSAVFGIIVAGAGMSGTPLGGLFIDYLNLIRNNVEQGRLHDEVNHVEHMSDLLTSPMPIMTYDQQQQSSLSSQHNTTEDSLLNNPNTNQRNNDYQYLNMNQIKLMELLQLQSSLSIVTISVFIGGICFCISYFFFLKYLFLFNLFFAAFFIFFASAGISMSVMLSVPERQRPLAMGMSILGLHLCGDVPSPVITGLIKDYLAPSCAISISNECRYENHGLRLTLLIVSLWIFVGVFFFALAWYLALTVTLRQFQAHNQGKRNNNNSSGTSSSSNNAKTPVVRNLFKNNGKRNLASTSELQEALIALETHDRL